MTRPVDDKGPERLRDLCFTEMSTKNLVGCALCLSAVLWLAIWLVL